MPCRYSADYDHDRLGAGVLFSHPAWVQNCESHYNFWFVNGLVNVFSLVHLIIALFAILIRRHVIGYINYMKRLELVMSRKISEV